jgi:hypothetical protein
MKMNVFFIVFPAVFVLPVFSQQNQLPMIEEVQGNIPEWAINLPFEENKLWAIGTGNLSTIEASREQAKFNAHVNLCGQLSMPVKFVANSFDNVQKNIIDRLDFYQNQYYFMVALVSINQACFELFGLTEIERIARTSDGTIWYLVSLNISRTKEIAGLSEYINEYFNSGVEDFKDAK